ncbi:MAG: Nif3-like dinuclear metal center hexameric protein [Nanoarchaeota archaeon]
MPSLKTLIQYCDDLLNIKAIEDKSLNGLQVDGPSRITKVAFAVDASTDSIQAAAAQKAQLLMVHHGLFWGSEHPLTGSLFERVKACITKEIALYAVHLPLDLHPVLGNNAQLLKLLELQDAGVFGDYHGIAIGKIGRSTPVSLGTFAGKVNAQLNTRSFVVAHGPSEISTVGIVSGGGSFALEEAHDLGIDVLLTGETSHSAVPVAKELNVNVIFAGHYATETLGVKALASHLKRKFKIATIFVDNPTGL